MNTTNDFPKSRPIQDQDLPGVLVMEYALGQLQKQIDEFRIERAIQQAQITFMWHLVRAMFDLVQELTDDKHQRERLEKLRLKAERQAALESLPTFFWRPEQGFSLPAMLDWRATYLIRRKRMSLDEAWALLKEFCSDYAMQEIEDDQLAEIIQNAQQTKVG